MSFLWPWFLLLLVLIPVLVAFYIWILSRKRRFAVHYSSLSLIREALPRHARWRQHLPFVLFTRSDAAILWSIQAGNVCRFAKSGRYRYPGF